MDNDNIVIVEEVGEKDSIRFNIDAKKKIDFFCKCIQNNTDMSSVLNKIVDLYLNNEKISKLIK